MKLIVPFIFFSSALLSACANFLAKPTSNEYVSNCYSAARNKNFARAEKECYAALINTDSVSSPKIKSQRLYKLGLIKQRLSKFSESELLIKESLQLEEMLSSPPKVIGSRLVELSISLAGQNKWLEGAPFLERVLPIAPQYSKQERARISILLAQYSHQLMIMKQAALAKRFKSTASLIVDNDTYIFRK